MGGEGREERGRDERNEQRRKERRMTAMEEVYEQQKDQDREPPPAGIKILNLIGVVGPRSNPQNRTVGMYKMSFQDGPRHCSQ